MSESTARRWLFIIAAAYLILATIYSVATPIFEASDELWHYPMVKYLADNGLALPPQDPANPGPWRQEGSQPPLYYMLAALLTAGIDTSDMDSVRRINPHADIGITRPDGNLNMIVHRADAEAFPWQGTVLAVHIARFFSILLGLGAVLVTYQLAREVFPAAPVVQVGAAALVAFLPMFLFISASVNNDNLSNFLGSLLILLIVRLLRMSAAPRWRYYALLGVATGAGLLAKFNIGFLIPLVALALLLLSLRLRDWRPVVIGGAISGGLTILIAGWWYARNIQLYGDPTGLNMFLDVVGRRAVPANAAQLWSERHSFTQAYWGFFGGVNLPLPEAAYLIFNLIGGLALLSAGVFLAFSLLSRARLAPAYQINAWLPALVTLLWPLVTFTSYLRWTAETPASQGRLIFGALACIALWMAVGVTWWLPQRLRPLVMAVVAGYFAVVALAVPFLVIAPAYAAPPQVAAGDEEALAVFHASSGGEIALQAAQVRTERVRPEDYVLLDTTWIVNQPFSRNWSLFVHLVTPGEVIISQRDVYPGQGRLATSDLTAGRAWNNPIAIWIPATAYAPMPLEVQLGFYDHQTGERMMLADNGETFTVGAVELLPRGDNPFDLPNPIRVNFGGQIELLGYALTDLSPAAGDTVELTLYWRGLEQLETDYKVFANVIDPATLTKHAASDGMPAQWNAPTSTWQPGKVIEDTHTLNINPDAPPGIYELELGLYNEADGQRLRIFTPDGGQADNYLNLNRVRIAPTQGVSGD